MNKIPHEAVQKESRSVYLRHFRGMTISTLSEERLSKVEEDVQRLEESIKALNSKLDLVVSQLGNEEEIIKDGAGEFEGVEDGELNNFFSDSCLRPEMTEENETASRRTHTVASRSAACYPADFSCSTSVLEHYTSHPVHIAASLPATQTSLPVPGGKTFLANVMARMLERARSKEEFRKNKVIADEAGIKEERVKVVPDVVEQQREKAANEVRINEEKREIIASLLHKAEDKNSESFLYLPRKSVITFVECLEEAHHYYNFIDYIKMCDIIKYDSSLDDIYDILAKMPALELTFKKVDDKYLRDVIEMRILDLDAAQKANLRKEYAKYLPCCDFITPRSNFSKDLEEIHRLNSFPELSSDVIRRGLGLYKKHIILNEPFQGDKCTTNPQIEFDCVDFYMNDRKETEFTPPHLVFNLVYRTRKKNFMMHLNPEVELREIQKLSATFYYHHFVDWIPPVKLIHVKSEMVRVKNVPHGVTVREIKEFFSPCGVVKFVKIFRADKFERCHAVNVFFEDEDAAERATQLTGKEMTVRGETRALSIKLSFCGLLPASCGPMPKDIISAQRVLSAVENAKDVGGMLVEVLEKYWYLSQPDVRDAFSSPLYNTLSE